MKLKNRLANIATKRVRVRALAVLTIISVVVVLLPSCSLTSTQPLAATTTQVTTTLTTTTTTTTTSQYDSVFAGYLSQMQAAGDNSLADTLVSLYKSEPDAARCIGYLQKAHPGLADLLVAQPWFEDGLNDSERAFIDYGLGGETTQGIAGATGIDDVLSDIIVNQQWVVDTVQLSGGVKYIVDIYDRPDAVSRENATTIVTIAKAAAPVIEKLNGAKYPLDAITVFSNYLINPENSGMGNGMIDLGLYTEGINQSQVYDLLHELTHVIQLSRKGNFVSCKEWIEEGFADFGAAYAGEELSNSILSWWDSSWTFSMQEKYDADLSYAGKMGLSNVPLSSSAFDSESHTAKVALGGLFMNDLYSAMGENNYIIMMSGVYDWLTANPTIVLDENKLEDYALNRCLFHERAG